jgi:ribonuclease HI
VNKLDLLKAVYSAIDWELLYRNAPDAERHEVDELFRDLRERLAASAPALDATASVVAPQPAPDAAGAVLGASAVVYCDGASSGNPGPAAIGVVISDPAGRELLAWGEGIGRATNNVAEYRAAIAGLQKALELGARSVELCADSELLIRQVRGEYRVKNAGLRPLHAKVLELLARFERSSASYVPREKNSRADALAAAAVKKAKRS